jgi:GAF domain-containing protein
MLSPSPAFLTHEGARLTRLTAATDHPGLAEEQAALRRIATLVAEQPAPEEVFTAVTEVVGPLLGADLTAMLVYPGEGAAATTIAGWSAAGPMLPVGLQLPLDGDSVTARIFRTAASARMDSYVDVSGDTAEVARGFGLRSTVGAPILVDGTLWGALMAATRAAEPLPETTEARLAGFTDLVATAIANVEARSKLQRLATEQEALRKAATLVASGASTSAVFAQITASASEVFGVPFASLIRFLPEGAATMVAGCRECSTYVGMSWELPEDDPGIARAVVRTGEPARIDDHSRVAGPVGEAARALGVGSVVGAPVLVDGAMWGVLVVGAPQDGPPLAADVGERLVGFTELVTTTLINAETREEVRSLLEEQETLRRVATQIARGADPEAVFAAVCDEAVALFDAEQAAVVRLEDDESTVVVGLSAVIGGMSAAMRGMTIGMRARLGDWPTTSAACRTGRAARRDVTGEETTDTGPIPDLIRAQGFLSTISAPIAVDGRVWGAMTVSDSRSALPSDMERRIESFTELVATAIASREAREALAASEVRARELADEQAALRRVATLVAAGIQPSKLFSAVSDELAQLFTADGAGVGRYEPDGAGVVIVGRSEHLRRFPLGSRQDLDESIIAGEVYRTGRAVRIDVRRDDVGDAGALGELAQGVLDMGYFSIVAAPIVVEGELWGLVSASSSEGSLPPNTETRIESFGELVATAIANAESRGELAASEARARELANEQAALRRVAMLVAAGVEPDELFTAVSEEVAQLFKADGAAVGRLSPDGSGIEAVGRSSGLRGIPVGTHADIAEWPTLTEVLRTGRAARWTDKLYASVAAPIMVGGSLWGVVTAGSGHEGFPSRTEERLEKFGELVATAIANAESGAELAASEARARELANEQAALRRVATLVAQGATPDELFSAVAAEVAGIIDIPVVGIQRYEADGTFTVLGTAGETSFAVGSRWPIEAEGISGTILATGRPARRDDYSTMTGRLGEALREDALVSVVGVPIVVDGSIWGFMVAGARPGRPIPSDTEEQLVRFTELVATAVSNATTRTELLTSRARVVSAADEERRRLERDLHDGIQQWLVALALRARKAAGLSAAGESPVQELSGLADDLVAVTDELREISRGIHPAILSEAGLDDALGSLARRSAIPVALEVDFQRRFDPTLEATVYYVAAESITNAVKHARASTIAVRGGLRGDAIELEIADDGVGGADPRRGTGLIGLEDRVDTLGGTISIASPVGAGTTVHVRLSAVPANGESPFREPDEGPSAPASG